MVMSRFGGSGGLTIGGGGAPPAKGGGGGPPTVGERDFEAEVLTSELPVVMQFTAEWCQPCKQIAPEVAAFAQEMQGKVKVVKIDIDKSPNLARQLRVQSVPTFMVFANQRIVDGVAGAVGKKKLREMVEPYLPRTEGAVKPRELAELIKQHAVVPVDTRDAAAYGRAHLPGAQHMALDEIEGRLAELHMMAGTPVLYCRGGDKTKDLAARLNESGVPVAFLEGGLLGWESESLPIERP
jgi:thioredoxin 1/putative thioredoxin